MKILQASTEKNFTNNQIKGTVNVTRLQKVNWFFVIVIIAYRFMD